MAEVMMKEIDAQGRILLPRQWRKELKSNKVVVFVEDTVVKIVPKAKKLSEFFTKAKPSALRPDPFEDYQKSLAEATLE